MIRRLSSTHLEAADRFHSAAIHALRFVAREDPASGLSAARLSALSVLVFGGAKTLGELAAAEQVRPPTMTNIVRGLEQAGLVRREADPRDGRVVRLTASAKGRRVLERARERRIAKLAERLAGLDVHEVERVRDAAELVEDALRPSSARPERPARAGGSAGS
jgi:DNA-binding MarR family transcriptional regulator